MTQDWLGQFAVTRRARAFLRGIFVDRKPWRIDPEFDKLAGPNVSLDDFGGNVEVLGVLGVHRYAAYQLVIVGEVLVIELLFQVSANHLRIRVTKKSD